MITKKNKLSALLGITLSICASSMAMEDGDISSELASLNTCSLPELLNIAENTGAHATIRMQALDLLINQEKDFELQAQARIYLAVCHRTGALHTAPSIKDARELIQPIKQMAVSPETKAHAQREWNLIQMLLRRTQSSVK